MVICKSPIFVIKRVVNGTNASMTESEPPRLATVVGGVYVDREEEVNQEEGPETATG